jgi:hypothetical protein
MSGGTLGARQRDGDSRAEDQAEREPGILADVRARIDRRLHFVDTIMKQLPQFGLCLVDLQSIGVDLLSGSFDRGRRHRGSRLWVMLRAQSTARMQKASEPVVVR